MKSKNKELVQSMIEKSKEAFLLAIEIYNKPTIKYKIEGFTFFICNAWELMLKAYLLSINKSIHYHNKNINRTISLSDAIKRVMTNSKDPVRINLESVVGLRNMANHLIIPEYATLFNEIFLACTQNYCTKLTQLFNNSINDILLTNYMTMFIPSGNETVKTLGKYPKEVQQKFEATRTYLKKILVENSTNGAVPLGLAVSYQMTIKQVKNIEDADLTYTKTGNKNAELLVVHKTVDPNLSHPFSSKMVISNVNQELLKLGIEFTPVSENAKKTFNTHTFGLYIKFHKVKENAEFAYKHSVGKTQAYTYSLLLVQKIIDDILQDPDLFKNIKDSLRV